MIRLVSTTRRLIQKTARNSVFGTVNLRCFSFGMGNIMGSEESNMGGAQKNGVAETHYVLKGNRIQPPFPEGIQTCVFGTGCFWGTVCWSRMQITQNGFPSKRLILLMLRCNIIGGFGALIPYDYTFVYTPLYPISFAGERLLAYAWRYARCIHFCSTISSQQNINNTIAWYIEF